MFIVDFFRSFYINRIKDNPRRYADYLKKKGGNIGNDVYIYNGYIDETYINKLSIGNNVILSETTILLHDASTQLFINKTKVEPVEIGNNVFVGYKSIILPGCRIGDNVIIGAGTVVRGNIPNDSVVIGNPGKIVKNVQDYIMKISEQDTIQWID